MKSTLNYLSKLALIAILFSCENENNKIIVKNVIVKNAINTITLDANSNIWIGQPDGLYIVKSDKLVKVISELDTMGINCLIINNGDLWAATNKGAAKFNITNDNKIVLDTLLSTKNSLIASSVVYCIAFDNQKRQWFGTSKGISMLSNGTWLSNSKINKNLTVASGRNITGLALRHNDCNFTSNGKYLIHVKFESETDAITGASQWLGGGDSDHSFNGKYTTDTTFCVYVSRDTALWFGSKKGLTRNKGENRSGEAGSVFEYFLEGERVHAVVEASDGKIWAGSEKGVFVKEADKWTNYTTNNGLPSNIITAIAEYNNKIWIQTNAGVVYFENGTIH